MVLRLTFTFYLFPFAFLYGSSFPFLPFFFGCSTSRGRVAGAVGVVTDSVFFGAVVGGGALFEGIGGGGSSIPGAGGNVICSILGAVIVSEESAPAAFLP